MQSDYSFLRSKTNANYVREITVKVVIHSQLNGDITGILGAGASADVNCYHMC